jgi:cell division protein FtsW (lipid II flippase)
MKCSEGDIVQFLFVSTDYFFSHRDKMPQCSQLKTFREPRDRLAAARELSYFHWWNLLSFRAWSIFGLIILLSALVVDYKRGGQNTPLTLFAVCLWIVGIAIVLLNCFFAQLQPRYVLPMMELLLLSVMIFVGVLLSRCSNVR